MCHNTKWSITFYGHSNVQHSYIKFGFLQVKIFSFDILIYREIFTNWETRVIKVPLYVNNFEPSQVFKNLYSVNVIH